MRSAKGKKGGQGRRNHDKIVVPVLVIADRTVGSTLPDLKRLEGHLRAQRCKRGGMCRSMLYRRVGLVVK